LENTEENSEKIVKIWNQIKLNNEKIRKIQKQMVKWF